MYNSCTTKALPINLDHTTKWPNMGTTCCMKQRQDKELATEISEGVRQTALEIQSSSTSSWAWRDSCWKTLNLVAPKQKSEQTGAQLAWRRKKWLIMSICFGLAPLCFGDLWELFLKSFALMFAEVWHYFMLDTPPLQGAVLVLILSNISWDRWHIVHGSKENCENNRGRNSVLIWPLRQTDDANFFSPPSLLKFITLH